MTFFIPLITFTSGPTLDSIILMDLFYLCFVFYFCSFKYKQLHPLRPLGGGSDDPKFVILLTFSFRKQLILLGGKFFYGRILLGRLRYLPP